MSCIDEITERAVRRFLSLLPDRYEVADAFVYGSRARGTHRPDSDADVAILLEGAPPSFTRAKLDMADIAFDVLLETGVHVSPLPIAMEDWRHPEQHPNPSLLRNIERDGVRL